MTIRKEEPRRNTSEERPLICVADDTETNLTLLGRILHQADYDVSLARSGRELFAALEEVLPDLFLLDVMMPDMNGFDICRRLKAEERTRGIPVIFLTALQDEGSLLQGFEAGGVDYVTKPFSKAELLSRIGTHLALKRTERDLTRALRERDMLLREVHHRVKNNLGIILSLLALQKARTTDASVVMALEDTIGRVSSVAVVHEHLHRAQGGGHIAMRGYLTELTRNLSTSLGAVSFHIAVSVDAEDLFLDADRAIPCGLIVNELVTNACKYAFPGYPEERENRLRVAFFRTGGDGLRLSVEDNGTGLSPGTTPENCDSMGFQVVLGLAQQLNGTVSFRNDGGLAVTVAFPAPGV